MKSEMALQRSDVQLPNSFDVNIFLDPSAFNPVGTNSPLVLIAAFLTNPLFTSSKIIR